MAKTAGLWKNEMNILLQRNGFTVIDSEGYRPNVGIILCNTAGLAVSPRRHSLG